MQSQQKRLKWSRGETSEALEERTDTGITQASVELMENCIPDIYGNISRRPGLKLLDGIKTNCYNFICPNDDLNIKFVPFYITEDDIILFNICTTEQTETKFLRIRNGRVIAEITLPSTNIHPFSGFLENGAFISKQISYSQQNNYMIIATESNIYKLTITINGDGFTPVFEYFKFSAGWYAPYGTQTKKVTTTEIPGLNISGHFSSYTFTYSNGDTNVFSWTDTGLDGAESLYLIAEVIPAGSIVQFPNNGAYFRVEGYTGDGQNVMMFGVLLTPVADENATDDVVKVEYGYELLQPNYSTSTTIKFPHPTKVAFYNQRLWAGDWKFSSDTSASYSLVVGSQIAKYSDFDNNYNQENEAITLDILTQYREKIIHIGDYNGLKIMTDAYEYSYQNGVPIRQSANGSLAQCEPIIFEGLCLYADSTGNQIRAMQYEFQSDIFNSSSINTMAPHDLIWNPITLATFEDKIYSTGKYLFVVNENTDKSPKVVVCNFVPSNQATIWSRWAFPDIETKQQYMNLIYDIVQTKKQPIFILKTNYFTKGGIPEEAEQEKDGGLVTAILDFNARCDLETTINSENRVIIADKPHYLPTQQDQVLTLINTQVAVYSDGEFKFLTTTTNKGYITDDLTGLTNITVGLPINATIRSHPIDVGGKTKSIKKRIGKTVMSVHDTEPGAITINGKTGYMNPQGDKISFYGVTGMKDEIKYTLTNKNGAMFHLESLLMNIEYGTLDS